MKHQRYKGQVQLMLRILPHIAEEECFALKGGTAINLFVRDLPRLSVDIDLTYVPIKSRDASLTAISAALRRIRVRIGTAIPGINIQAAAQSSEETRLICLLGDANVKIEVNTILRGVAWPTEELTVVDRVEDEFEYSASIQVVSLAELFGGKIAAALDRQHPRDLFDVGQLYEHGGLSNKIVKGFLVALISHSRPMHELLRPNLLNQREIFSAQFEGMALLPFTYDDFVAVREMLVGELPGLLSDRDKEFLLSLKRGTPDWNLAPVPGVENLPAVQWKLGNIRKLLRDKKKHAKQLKSLEASLSSI